MVARLFYFLVVDDTYAVKSMPMVTEVMSQSNSSKVLIKPKFIPLGAASRGLQFTSYDDLIFNYSNCTITSMLRPNFPLTFMDERDAESQCQNLQAFFDAMTESRNTKPVVVTVASHYKRRIPK